MVINKLFVRQKYLNFLDLLLQADNFVKNIHHNLKRFIGAKVGKGNFCREALELFMHLLWSL